jgi:hypothetical protein
MKVRGQEPWMNQGLRLAVLKRRRPTQALAKGTLKERILRGLCLPSLFRDRDVGLRVEKELRHRQPDKEADADKNEEAGRTLLVDEVNRCLVLTEQEPLLIKKEPSLAPFPTSESLTAGLARHRQGERLSLVDP